MRTNVASPDTLTLPSFSAARCEITPCWRLTEGHPTQGKDPQNETLLSSRRLLIGEPHHAELDEATELDRGDANDLAQRYAELCDAFPNIRVVGGCCGTDHSHIKKIAASL